MSGNVKYSFIKFATYLIFCNKPKFEKNQWDQMSLMKIARKKKILSNNPEEENNMSVFGGRQLSYVKNNNI